LVRPWKESDFKDKVVLDVGCGAGRLSRLTASYGAKYVVSVDLSGAVDEALELSKDYLNIHFLQASLFNLPLKIKFDLIFSLGVLHHTPSPFLGFKSILKSLKVGGKVGIWVYGKEGNKVMGPLLNLFRIITTRLNSSTRKRLSKIIIIMVEVFNVSIFKFFNNLFYGDYLEYFNRELSMADREYVAFDFMSTPIIKYISKRELDILVSEVGLLDVMILQRNGNSWMLTGRKQ
jgi:SAM-dependent methyltransferase